MRRSALASLVTAVAGIAGLLAAASGVGEPTTRTVAAAALESLTAERTPASTTTPATEPTATKATTTAATTTATAAPVTVPAPTRARAATVAPTTPQTSTAPQALTRPVVVLYGDSLAWEARHAFAFALAGHPDVQVLTRTFGGTAICDWAATMRNDVLAVRPGIVVVQFSGNAFTGCMRDASDTPLSGDALLERYRADASAAADLFVAGGTEVVFAGAPIPRDHAIDGPSTVARINEVYRQVASVHDGVAYIDAGAAVLADGVWTPTLPCLPAEPCDDGRAHVRAPDGLHFCPAGADADRGVTGECPVWSSGAFRFGGALADPILGRLQPA